MSLETMIRRLPRAHDPDLGAAARAAVPGLAAPLGELLAGAGGSSPFLHDLILKHADWLGPALGDPDAALAAEAAAAADADPDVLPVALRRAKARFALVIALADLSGAWPLERVTATLTDFAGLASDLALKAALAPLIHRGKLPGQGEDAIATAGGMTVLAMGKMGAHELNYSSDIDLICLFDETRFQPDDFFDARQTFVKATRAMCAMLGDRTADGYVFRTDLRLRPDPAVTPVVIAMEAAERYYESLGRTWERAAFIKARPCAGDLVAGERFLEAIRPFVWRRHLDFAAIEDAHAMRLRIRDHKGLAGPLSVPGHDIKLGRGGIREIEFFTQTRQLIAGGRDPDLRPRGTVDGLAALVAKGWVPGDVADTLTRHYRAHREVEHRIQMVHDAQTHKLPQSPEGLARVAALMGTDAPTLVADLKARLTEVHELTEDFFAPDRTVPRAGPAGFTPDAALMARWPTYPALRSDRAVALFDRLRPDLMARVAATERPEETLSALDGFLARLPAGVQVFSLLAANPQLIDLLVDIAGTSPSLAAYLSRNAAVFDAVIGGDFFAPWPGVAALRQDLTATLAREGDYELRLDAARRWARDWRFRIGVHHLRGLIGGAEAGREYSDLAQAVIAALLPVVTDEFARKHGAPPGRGAAILGMGSLGAGALHAASDLDIIVVYDPGEVEASTGKRPLPARTYYARLTQALITAMTAPMAEGKLYEVDMRLRPSGNQGPVATSLAAFRGYQASDAWVWEHLALTRARVMAGPEDLGREIEAFRTDLLSRPRDATEVLAALSDMRARIAEAKRAGGVFDVKTGPGRMQDIELLAQAGTLVSGSAAREVTAGLADAAALGWIDDAQGERLARFHARLWEIQVAARLLSGDAIDEDAIGRGAAAVLLRAGDEDGLDALRDALQAGYAEAAATIDAALAKSCPP